MKAKSCKRKARDERCQPKLQAESQPDHPFVTETSGNCHSRVTVYGDNHRDSPRWMSFFPSLLAEPGNDYTQVFEHRPMAGVFLCGLASREICCRTCVEEGAARATRLRSVAWHWPGRCRQLPPEACRDSDATCVWPSPRNPSVPRCPRRRTPGAVVPHRPRAAGLACD